MGLSNISGMDIPAHLDLDTLWRKTDKHGLLVNNTGPVGTDYFDKGQFVFSMNGEMNVYGEDGSAKTDNTSDSTIVVSPLTTLYWQTPIAKKFFRMKDETGYEYDVVTTDSREAITAFLEYTGPNGDQPSKGMRLYDLIRQTGIEKVGRAMDYLAFHGWNPATKASLPSIANLCFDAVIPTSNKITASATPDTDIVSGVALADGADFIAMDNSFRTQLAETKYANGLVYTDQVGLVGKGSFKGIPLDSNDIVSQAPSTAPVQAYLGNFNEFFRYGVAGMDNFEIFREKSSNNYTVRIEAYVQFAIMDPTKFAIINKPTP